MANFVTVEQFAVSEFAAVEQFDLPAAYSDEEFTVDDEIVLRDILNDLCSRVGLSASTDFGFSTATQHVDGFVIATRDSVRNIIAPLLQVYFADLTEIDGKLVSVNRGGSSVQTVPEDDLGAFIFADGRTESGPARLEVGRTQDVELPQRLDLTYFSKDNLYQQSTQGAVRQSVDTSKEMVTVNTPLTLGDDKARQAAESLLYDQWLQRTRYLLFLPPKYLKLAPGDVITLPTPMGNKRARIVGDEVAPFGAVLVKAVADDPGVVSQYAQGETPGNTGPSLFEIGDATLIAWNGNALLDEHADSVGIYLVAGSDQTSWAGCAVYMSSDGGASYQQIETLADAGIVGVADTVLGAAETTGLWDEVNTVDVTVLQGTPVSRSEAEVLAGENVCILGDEVLQFATVTPLGGNQYRLSKLLRGRRGTDAFWGDHAALEPFAILTTGTVKRAAISDGMINKNLLLKAVPVGKTLADVSADSVSIYGREYKCYAPCDVRGSRDESENLTITWKRRSRADADLRDYTDIPLGETTEAYEVDVMDGETVKRTLSSSTASVEYTAAQQTTDFGSTQAEVTVRVYQLGKYGRGYPQEATV